MPVKNLIRWSQIPLIIGYENDNNCKFVLEITV